MIAVGRLTFGGAAVALLLLVTAGTAIADTVRDRQWHLVSLGIADAHKVSQGESVIVAIPDTGVDTRHAELTTAVLSGKGLGEGNTTDGRTDTDGHGTAVAGLIAGRGLPNGGGVLGIAPKSMILPIQTTRGGDSIGSPALLAEGVDWATTHGAKVICIAAVTNEDPRLQEAVERALTADVVVVAGVGNTPEQTEVGFPAKLPGVLAVGGTGRNSEHASISATGPETLVAAPAADIVSTRPAGQYASGSGTSYATAIVSGVVALVRAKFPGLSGPEVVRRITATAVDKGKPGRDEEFGFGVVDPLAALTATLPSAAPQVSAVPSEVGSGPVGGGGGVGGWGVWIGVVGVVAVGVVGVLRWRRWRAGS
ncbi:S8 family serine peptidase [Dactylosporangium vinaceum]|uniref:S8 family serine peptidase n=1 Tax=Dactylosporangium vinaceum TaxID=53362 RepID=A0ABV5MB53_9ACTN|nr:S8 family serine peptidase [Dactylosporangium vinaceum]UAB98331.1 S8 family serine peptidase [Dactylosporangium vinaceum]